MELEEDQDPQAVLTLTGTHGRHLNTRLPATAIYTQTHAKKLTASKCALVSLIIAFTTSKHKNALPTPSFNRSWKFTQFFSLLSVLVQDSWESNRPMGSLYSMEV